MSRLTWDTLVTLLNYLAVVFPATIVCIYAISAVHSWYKLRHIPGPFLASFSFLWKFKIQGRTVQELAALEKHGKIVRVGPHYLLTSDPDILRQINVARSTYGRDDWFLGLRLGRDEHVETIADIGIHDRLKALLAPAYNGRDGVNPEADVDGQIERMKALIRRKYISSGHGDMRPVHFSSLARYFTIDVITAIAFGRAFGFLGDGEDLQEYHKSADNFLAIMTLICDITAPKPSDSKGLGRLIRTAIEIIDERYSGKSDKDGDMVASFKRHGLDRERAENETMIQILAGPDTTATAIMCTMLYIVTNPRVYNRLREDIRATVVSGKASSPITSAEARKLPYLQAVLLEGIRMRPPIIYGHYKKVPPSGDVINGIRIPGGASIGTNHIGLMRNTDVFGADIDMFRPERFLENDEATKARMEQTVHLAFGTGRWGCAGKTIAFMELDKIYFKLLRDFNFEVVHPENAWIEKSGLTWYHKNLMMTIWERVETL